MEKAGSISTNPVQRMPVELQLNVFEYLDYQAAIRLSQTNRHFHTMIDTQKWPVEEKHDFCKDAEMFDKHTGYQLEEAIERTQSLCTRLPVHKIAVKHLHLYCRFCFTVKPAEEFSKSQVLFSELLGHDVEYKWDRFKRSCIDCSIAKGSYRHGLEIAVPTKVTGVLIMRKHGYEMHESWDSALIDEFRVPSPKLMKFCDTCQTLHSAEEWADLDCTHRQPTKHALKKGGLSNELSRTAKQTGQYKVFPTNRFCGLCDAAEPETALGDFYCPSCMIWVCWACCMKCRGKVLSRCGPLGHLHELSNGSSKFSTHQRLMQAQNHSDLPSTELLGAEDHMLSDVGFFDEP